jgi:hypothetical protein
VVNVVRSERVIREIDEELESHIDPVRVLRAD